MVLIGLPPTNFIQDVQEPRFVPIQPRLNCLKFPSNSIQLQIKLTYDLRSIAFRAFRDPSHAISSINTKIDRQSLLAITLATLARESNCILNLISDIRGRRNAAPSPVLCAYKKPYRRKYKMDMREFPPTPQSSIMSEQHPVEPPVHKRFLALTPTSPKESTSSPSSPPSRRSLSEPCLPTPSFREHRGSSASDSSAASSDVGENGFLILTPPERGLENTGLKKIDEEAVE